MKTPKEKTATRVADNREALVLALGVQLSALLSASRTLTVQTSAEFHPGLPPAAFHIARWLHAFGPAKVSRVAEAVAMDRSATSRLTGRLIELGLVDARADPLDGRATVLGLTRLGERKVRQTILHKGDTFRQRIVHLSDAELEQLARLLGRFNGLF